MSGSTPSLSGPSGSETLLQTGQRALEGRQWSKAAEAFGQLVRAEPGVVQGWLGLGIAALEQKRYRLALQALDQARSLAPQDPYVAVNLARRWPQLPLAHYHLGHVRLVQGRCDEAETSLRQALELQLGDDAAHQALVACICSAAPRGRPWSGWRPTACSGRTTAMTWPCAAQRAGDPQRPADREPPGKRLGSDPAAGTVDRRSPRATGLGGADA